MRLLGIIVRKKKIRGECEGVKTSRDYYLGGEFLPSRPEKTNLPSGHLAKFNREEQSRENFR